MTWQCQLRCAKLLTESNTDERRTPAWIPPLQQKYPGSIYFVLGILQVEKAIPLYAAVSNFRFAVFQNTKK